MTKKQNYDQKKKKILKLVIGCLIWILSTNNGHWHWKKGREHLFLFWVREKFRIRGRFVQ